MLEFVREYLDGENERLFFDLDFIHYLNENYDKMEREDPDFAECFAFYIGERGFDKSKGLTDDQHKALIREQYDEFLSAMRDGFI
jgi:hypothetical protein